MSLAEASAPRVDIQLDALGELTPISRSGGQGRVYLPAHVLAEFGAHTVVKLYRTRVPTGAALALAEMVAWAQSLPEAEQQRLHRLAAWPLATVSSHGTLAGIAMRDLRARFELPFLMPSGRVSNVMLQLEHLLGGDDFLMRRGQQVLVGTRTRAVVAERICAAFAFLHRQGIVVSDVSPSNLLISLRRPEPSVCFIDCDSMVFRGHQALAAVETADWQIPAAFGERPLSRASDDYKLGLVVLRLFARSSDARDPDRHREHLPPELRPLLRRALSADATNRPAAGEWQLALRHALSDERLAERHPGPPTPTRRPQIPAPPRPFDGYAYRPRGGVAQPIAAAAAAGSPEPPRHPSRSRGLLVATILIAAVLFVLLLHLMQGAMTPQAQDVRIVQPNSLGTGGYYNEGEERSGEEGGVRSGEAPSYSRAKIERAAQGGVYGR